MKTLPISEDLLKKICTFFLIMEPIRQYLVDDCLESKVYDELKESFPEFMEE